MVSLLAMQALLSFSKVQSFSPYGWTPRLLMEGGDTRRARGGPRLVAPAAAIPRPFCNASCFPLSTRKHPCGHIAIALATAEQRPFIGHARRRAAASGPGKTT